MPSCIVQSRYGGRRTTYCGRACSELFLLDPDVVYLEPRLVRRLPAAGLRALPGLAARARARAGRLHRHAACDGLLAEARAALAAYVGAQAGRPDLRPERDDGREHGRARRSTCSRATRCCRPTSSTARATSRGSTSARGGRALRARGHPPAARRRHGAIFARRTERTRAVYVSHITSETGLLPPGRGDRRSAPAREGLVAIVDGAHAPGQRRPRPGRARRRLLRRQLPQVALRAEGRRLPPRAPRLAGARRRRRSSAGATRSPRRSSRARSARARATPPRTSPFPTRSRSCASTTCATAACTRARRARGALRAARHASRSRRDDAIRQLVERAATASRRRRSRNSSRDDLRIEIPTMGPTSDDLLRRLGRAVHGTGGRRAAARRPPAARLELPAALRDAQADERAKLSTVLLSAGGRLDGVEEPDTGQVGGRTERLPLVRDGRALLHERVTRREQLRPATCSLRQSTAAPACTRSCRWTSGHRTAERRSRRSTPSGSSGARR